MLLQLRRKLPVKWRNIQCGTLERGEVVKSQWTQFIELGEVSSSVPRIIRESWIRSRKYGIDPFQLSLAQLSKDTVNEIKEKNKRLIQVSRAAMQKVNVTLGNQSVMASLHDRDGVIIDLIGGNSLALDEIKDSNIKVGAVWREDTVGTSAPSTSLATGELVLVTGAEHYNEFFHRWECAAAPIWDHVKQEICGILNLATTTHGNPLLLPMVSSLTEAIAQSYEWSYRHQKQMELNLSILNHVDDLIMMIDQDGMILTINRPPFYTDIFKVEHQVGTSYIDSAFGGRKFDHNGKYQSLLIETLETGKEYRLHEHRRRLADGTEKNTAGRHKAD